MRLLLAEDDSDMRELIASELRGDGWDVLEASDGRELAQMLDRLVVDPGSMPLVDLVVTDVRMPGPSGLEVLEDLRAWSLAPPVIVITAFGDAELHELALRLGAAAVLDKPFDVDELRMLARTLVPLRGGTTPPTSRRHA